MVVYRTIPVGCSPVALFACSVCGGRERGGGGG